jgi:hypothetical protein
MLCLIGDKTTEMSQCRFSVVGNRNRRQTEYSYTPDQCMDLQNDEDVQVGNGIVIFGYVMHFEADSSLDGAE